MVGLTGDDDDTAPDAARQTPETRAAAAETEDEPPGGAIGPVEILSSDEEASSPAEPAQAAWTATGACIVFCICICRHSYGTDDTLGSGPFSTRGSRWVLVGSLGELCRRPTERDLGS